LLRWESSNVARAVITPSKSFSNTSATAFDAQIVSNDLINTGQSSYLSSSVTASDNTGMGATGAHDGVGPGNTNADLGTKAAWIENNGSITYQLNLNGRHRRQLDRLRHHRN
jgi:hypothetical protein